jgi:acetolactate synthase-1/2/3 large subunit
VEFERLGYSISLDGDILLAAGIGPDSAGWLFAIESDTWEKIDSLYSSGIAVAGDRLYRLLCTSSHQNSEAKGELLVYDESGVVDYHRIDCLDDPHALICDGEYLVTPCPAVNTIFWLGFDGAVKRAWTAPGTADAWHVNSVHAHRGRLYASAFGRFGENYGWSHDMDAPVGMIFDVESQTDVVSGLCCPHDPLRVDGGWLVCNSRPGDLLFIDESGSIARKVNMGGWTRGMAVSERHVFVGVSGERHSTTDPSRSAIVVLDRNNWTPLARIMLPCVELFTLSLVPRKFLRGLHRGFRTNATRVSGQDREDMFRAVGSIHPQCDFTPMDAMPPDDCRCVITVRAASEIVRGAGLAVEVEVTNCGPVTLLTAPPHPIHLGYRWLGLDALTADPEVDCLRFPLPQALAPGGRLKWKVSLPTPSASGSYSLAFSLVQEWVAWFDELNNVNGCRLRVDVQETAS